MANSTEVTNYCLSPFLPEASFKELPGSTSARWCKDILIGDEKSVSCCLPCPAAQWRYSDRLMNIVDQASWSAIPTLCLVVFILVSYLFLPAAVTGRHFLTASATIGFVFFQLSWIIPLKSKPEICRDEITATDFRTDMKCAFGGSSLLFGVWIVILTCFFGALLLHLTVCWEKGLGRKFQIFCITCIFGGSVGFLALALGVTGISYQISNMCFINAYKSRATFWGPLIAFSGATLVIELLTIGYRVYMVGKPLYEDWKLSKQVDYSQRRSSFEWEQRIAARSASARVRQVVQLQWRVVVVVCLVLFHGALLAGAFLQVTDLYEAPLEELIPWVACLATEGMSKEDCRPLIKGLGPDENFFAGALVLLIVCPFWDFVVLAHRPMFKAWWDILRGRKPTDDGLTRGRASFGFGGGSSSKAIIERDVSRISGSATTATPGDDDVVMSDLKSQNVNGWQSPTNTTLTERTFTPPAEWQYEIPHQSFSAPRRPRCRNGDV